jgi:hypothetical protein
MGGEHTRDRDEVKAFYDEIIVVDDEGRPNTQHLVSNIQVEVADDCESGTGQSTFTVFNTGDGFPLQCIITGFYHDKFRRVDGKWRLTERVEHMGLVGDLSHHLIAGLQESSAR